MEEERIESTPLDPEIPETQPENRYVPRPAYQIWAAWIGVVIVAVGFILYLYRIATGGM